MKQQYQWRKYLYHNLFYVSMQETFMYAFPWIVVKLGIIVAKVYSYHNYMMYERKWTFVIIVTSWMTFGNVVLFIFI